MSEPQFRPWGTVTPEFWSVSTPPGLSAETLRARLVKVAEVAQSGRPADAAVLAEKLDQDVTREYGGFHLYTAQVREVRGYLATLTGDHSTGLAWYLHGAQLRATIQGADHPDVAAASRRAFSLWRAIPSDNLERPHLGAELLRVTTELHGEGAAVVRRTRECLYDLVLPTS
ncbi:hypothetical protein [Streptomyces acidiscabies]|uniref:hypothetical protein n=1 Tax=Streptomyces acidiscabies TaxID=42234 RepID=UPI00073E40FC|nr:hypothetical protein [Streptomyces acidiscabies]GAQ53821.1 hypothetical protein a10_03626 [Streptomyces acidiscabies]